MLVLFMADVMFVCVIVIHITVLQRTHTPSHIITEPVGMRGEGIHGLTRPLKVRLGEAIPGLTRPLKVRLGEGIPLLAISLKVMLEWIDILSALIKKEEEGMMCNRTGMKKSTLSVKGKKNIHKEKLISAVAVVYPICSQ